MEVEVEDFLAHYGVKGMRWGFRKDRSTGQHRRSGRPARGERSEDSKRAQELRRHPVNTLSNKELRELNTRLQLEATYKQLSSAGNSSRLSRGANYVNGALRALNTATQIYNLKNNPIVKDGARLLAKKR